MQVVSRQPNEAAPARIQPLAVLPVFLDLTGKRAVVAGGSDGAAWKAELLWKTRKRSIPLPAASATNDRS
ncbi:hypothetical protein GCM10010869_39190 [Mesorhizobium tianshanense]|uniref:Uroporphyrin-III C-methyltransferase/precorrin-2 dehydrogenase/sirohydrochlorin ferrochelatase n=1 Tax=Mesorhizobium tianshanense TaxID=39844 RepID=A0A562NWU8_9HYPH|nr:uroporphyrin-III C-methyltransferase/precorrin-2 dehydrogenase/sirohydrochlorin ferrochelatase [Mesorhizobium tianshanense]GLS38325.1 hypothetical protein GCM10010869_39190 [Mesorhizobium tianshanense]